MRLYIVRHADPDYENNTITREGHKEASALAKKFLSHGLDKIFTSPMGRAIDTAKYTSELLNVKYNIEEWTREMWPDLFVKVEKLGDKALFQFPGEAFRSKYPLPTHETWHEADVFKDNRNTVIEAVEELKSKSDDFLSRLGYERAGGLYRCKKPNQDQVAIFCHGGFALTWLSQLLEIPVTLMWSGFWLPPSSVTTILFEERSTEWAVPRCIGLGDISHIYEAGLKTSKMGLEGNIY